MAFIHESAFIFYNVIYLKTIINIHFWEDKNGYYLFRILIHFCCHLFQKLDFNLGLIIKLSVIFYDFFDVLDLSNMSFIRQIIQKRSMIFKRTVPLIATASLVRESMAFTTCPKLPLPRILSILYLKIFIIFICGSAFTFSPFIVDNPSFFWINNQIVFVIIIRPYLFI